jgi:hypothetical protein
MRDRHVPQPTPLLNLRRAAPAAPPPGAALELSTILAPNLFLPLACTANLAKNLAAVANSSTRAPIYRTFAQQNNLVRPAAGYRGRPSLTSFCTRAPCTPTWAPAARGPLYSVGSAATPPPPPPTHALPPSPVLHRQKADITAKGESVANLADILGTLAGIALSKAKLPMVATFVVLSAGYLVASRKVRWRAARAGRAGRGAASLPAPLRRRTCTTSLLLLLCLHARPRPNLRPERRAPPSPLPSPPPRP